MLWNALDDWRLQKCQGQGTVVAMRYRANVSWSSQRGVWRRATGRLCCPSSVGGCRRWREVNAAEGDADDGCEVEVRGRNGVLSTNEMR